MVEAEDRLCHDMAHLVKRDDFYMLYATCISFL